MTDSYCSANDSYALLDLARRNRLSNYASSPLWHGIDILSRQLPALLRWLDQIQNEVPPQDSYQANRQGAVLTEILQLQQQNLATTAAINVAISQAQLSTSSAAKLSVIVNMIASQAQQLISPQQTIIGNSMSVVQTPFGLFQSSAFNWACWFVNGASTANCPSPVSEDQNLSGGPPSTAQLTHYITVTLGLSSAQIPTLEANLQSTWKALLPRVQVLVNADFARVLATNAGTILASARVKAGGSPLSPTSVLKNILEFLNQVSDANNPQLSVVLDLEKGRITETLRQLEAPDSEICPYLPSAKPGEPTTIQTPEQCLNSRLVVIFNLFALQNGTQVFLTDINNLINIDLQNRLSTNVNFPTDTLKILQASGQDISVALQTAGIGDLDPIADDLAMARADIQSNIQVFREFFVNGFEDAVKREDAMTADEDIASGPNRPHGQKLGELCMLWFLTSGIPTAKNHTLEIWPSSSTQHICEKTLYFNENDSPNGRGTFTPAFNLGNLAGQVSSLPFMKRACVFHNYKIQNRAKTLYVGDQLKH